MVAFPLSVSQFFCVFFLRRSQYLQTIQHRMMTDKIRYDVEQIVCGPVDCHPPFAWTEQRKQNRRSGQPGVTANIRTGNLPDTSMHDIQRHQPAR